MYTIQKQYYRELELNELEKLGVFLINGRLIFVANELFKNGHSNKQVEEVVNKINKLWYYNRHSSRCILNACRKVTIVVYEDDKVKGEAQFPLVVATVSILLLLADDVSSRYGRVCFKAITVYCKSLNKTSRKTIVRLLTSTFPQVGSRVMVDYKYNLVINNPTIDSDMMFIHCMEPHYVDPFSFASFKKHSNKIRRRN